MKYLPQSEVGPCTAFAYSDCHAFKGLASLLFSLYDLHLYSNGIAEIDRGDILIYFGLNHSLDVHRYSPEFSLVQGRI
jgi:sulfur transfer protein SufE